MSETVADSLLKGSKPKMLGAAEEEEEFHKLRPANKTDYLCQSWQ